jgi:hypothetical protein
MMCKRATAVLFVAALAFLPAAAIVGAEEEPAATIPFTPGSAAEGYGVYFADNMAFTPQWRVGNLVRIETMVLKAGDSDGDGLLDAASIPVAVNTNMTSGVVNTQASLMANPNDILYTWMVSVPQIKITASSATTDDVVVFQSNFADGITDADTVTREINKMGHLIYGLLWDTTEVDAGVYKISVEIPGEYPVVMALRSLLVAEEADPIGYEVLPTDVGGLSGQGGIELPNNAYLYLGKLMIKGGSSGGGSGNQGGGGGGGRK